MAGPGPGQYEDVSVTIRHGYSAVEAAARIVTSLSEKGIPNRTQGNTIVYAVPQNGVEMTFSASSGRVDGTAYFAPPSLGEAMSVLLAKALWTQKWVKDENEAGRLSAYEQRIAGSIGLLNMPGALARGASDLKSALLSSGVTVVKLAALGAIAILLIMAAPAVGRRIVRAVEKR